MDIKKNLGWIISTAAVFVAVLFVSATQKKENMLTLQFENFAGNEILKLDNVVYKNELNQPFTVTKFKYYISNILLKRKDGKEFLFKEYFLVNEDEPESKNVLLKNIPMGEYESISFIIGVDSASNCSGAQSGALDPVNGMFWAWNTGYIFLKLEGKSSFSKQPANIFEYHIGGYKAPANCIHKTELKLNLNVSENSKNKVNIKADVLEILKTPIAIDFAKLSSVTDFHNAAMIADNYKDMFRVISQS